MSQTARYLYQHTISGERFVVEAEADWDENDRCIGSHYTGASNALHHTEIPDRAAALWDYELNAEDADWVQAEDDAGHWTPILQST